MTCRKSNSSNRSQVEVRLKFLPLGVVQTLLIFVFICICQAANSAPVFPKLVGRVVDEANLLSASDKQELSAMLARHEQETSNQLVVVTVDSLQGYAIEDYGYQLGRQWGIGQGDKNNGVILLVAPHERLVRIEVGYGLEGVLTDALSKNIIETVILPQFRNNNYPAGIKEGVQSIINALAGTYAPQKTRTSNASNLNGLGTVFIFAIIAGEMLTGFFSSRMKSGLLIGGASALFTSFLLSTVLMGVLVGVGVFLFHILIGGRGRWPGGYGGTYYGGGYGGGSGSGGGFSGGGGSFGGGGASGRW